MHDVHLLDISYDFSFLLSIKLLPSSTFSYVFVPFLKSVSLSIFSFPSTLLSFL